MLYKSRCIVFHRIHSLAWNVTAYLRYQSTIISVLPWFVVVLVCFVVSVFAHLARQHMSLAHAPQCALMFDFSPLCVFKCAHSPPCALMFLHCAFSSNVPTPPCSLMVMGHNIHSLPSQTWGVFCPSLSFVFLLYFICTNVNTSYLYLF